MAVVSRIVPPNGERRQSRADGDEQAEPDEQTGVEGRGLVELVAAAGEVAHDERESSDEAAGEAAARLVVAGEEQVERERRA